VSSPSKLSQRLAGGIPASALASPAAAAPERSVLSQRLEGIQRGDDVELPLLGPVYLQLLGHTDSNRVEAGTFKAMEEEGLPAINMHAFSYDVQRSARWMALAARDPRDHSIRLGPLEEWVAIDDDVLFACGQIYKDLKARLDPFGAREIDESACAELAAAFEKKDRILMLSYGIGTLTSWLLSGALQLTPSPTPSSQSGEPLPDDSPKL
jgi:hypothetical protein